MKLTRLLMEEKEKVFIASELDEDGRYIRRELGVFLAKDEQEARRKLRKSGYVDAFTGFARVREVTSSQINKLKNELKQEIKEKMKQLKALENPK